MHVNTMQQYPGFLRSSITWILLVEITFQVDVNPLGNGNRK